jgi:myo-inositol-1(or 4)-monophosphatase
MNKIEARRALHTAVKAAWAAGAIMRQHLRGPKTVHATAPHDLKLELDVRCQTLIESRLLAAFPNSAILGEEHSVGDPGATLRWVVDPIDGTVNFAHGVPHAAVSIALQERLPAPARSTHAPAPPAFRTIVGAVYDPFTDEIWTAIRGGPARLDSRTVAVSNRRRLAEAVLSLGFGKHDLALGHLLPAFQALTPQVRKLRVMGSAALDLAYVAAGRFDGCLEAGLRLWDIAAGCLLVECAGGVVTCNPLADGQSFEVLAANRFLSGPIRRHVPPCAESAP